jgi:isopenicillin-N epimerase
MKKLSEFLHIDCQSIALVPNVTLALNSAAWSLIKSPSQRVVFTSLAYGSVKKLLRLVSSGVGASCLEIEIPIPVAGPKDIVEAIVPHLDSSTVLFLDHITSNTALALPILAILKSARAVGAVTVVDGAHAPLLLGTFISIIANGRRYFKGSRSG